MDWDDVKYFSVVARSGSVRAAADELGVAASTVTRRMDQFEARLGVTLVNRSQRGLTLTPAGEKVVAQVANVATQLGDIERQLHGQDQRLEGRVRVSIPDAIAATFLMDDLVEFNSQYPLIQVELIPTYRGMDLSRRQVDLSLMPTDHPPETLVGRPLSTFGLAIYGRREAVEAYQASEEQPAFVGWVGETQANRMFTTMRRKHFPDAPVVMRCDHLIMQQAAVHAGVGFAALPCLMAESDDKLVRLPDVAVEQGPMLWLLTHPDLRNTERVRALMNFLQDVFTRREATVVGSAAPIEPA